MGNYIDENNMKIFLFFTIALTGLSYSNINLNQSIYSIGWEKFLADESSELTNLELTWEKSIGVPSWIQGSYMKNGPSQRRFGTEERWYNNYMDGWGKLIKVTFPGDGTVKYSGRMIETDNYLKCKEANKVVPTITLGEVKPNDWSPSEMMEEFVNLFDNTNVILWRLGPEISSSSIHIVT